MVAGLWRIRPGCQETFRSAGGGPIRVDKSVLWRNDLGQPVETAGACVQSAFHV